MIRIVLLIALTIPTFAFAQKFKTAIEYNDYLIKTHQNIMQKNFEYIKTSVHSSRERKVDNKRENLIKEIEKSIKNLEKAEKYEGDLSNFKELTITVFNMYLDIFSMDYKNIDIMAETSEENYENMEKFMKAKEAASDKLAEAGQKMQDAQIYFAETNNIQLIEKESELHKQMKIINELNKYTNEIYLLYFKVSKLNARFLDNINANDPNKAKETCELLKTTAEENIEKLKEIKSFKNSTFYRDKTIALLNFYKTQTQTDYVTMTDIMSKPQNTKADVDKFNKLINNYNTKQQTYVNAMNDAYNKLMQSNVQK